jgi:cytoskeletal protein RodZ
MHLDHSKLIDLLAETSGIDKEKVENQLEELVGEINEAIEEGEAYEVDGFGVFSAIGNNVVFIPADELATEINYKYVGMEAIEMDEASDTVDEPDAQDEDDPFAGLLDDEAKEDTASGEPVEEPVSESDQEGDEESSPFEIEDGEQKDPEEDEKPGPDKWGIDTYKEEGTESMFSGLLGDPPKEESEQEEEHFKAVFDQEDDNEDEDLERISEIERELSGEEDEDNKPSSKEEEGDPFAMLAGEGDNDEESEEDDLDEALGSAISDDDHTEDEDLEEALSSSISEDSNEDELDPVPVIKNLASEKEEKKKETDKATKEKEKKRQPFKRPQKAKEPGSQSAVLLIIIIILVLGGGIYGLGYFGLVNIPGITPADVPATTQTTPPAPSPEMDEPQQEQSPSGSESEAATNDVAQDDPPTQDSEPNVAQAEQEPSSQVSETQGEREQPSAGEASYGLRGSVNEAANDGYTIVVYSLTNEENARSKVSELSDQGYRVILADIPHQQYGTLWRVSMGQFETMRDAALAAQDLGDPFTDNYFVTQIQ